MENCADDLNWESISIYHRGAIKQNISKEIKYFTSIDPFITYQVNINDWGSYDMTIKDEWVRRRRMDESRKRSYVEVHEKHKEREREL